MAKAGERRSKRASASISRLTTEAWALEYVRRGWALTPLWTPTAVDPERAKRPVQGNWQRPEQWVITEEKAHDWFKPQDAGGFGERFDNNVGLVHAGSRTLALDVDHLDLAVQFFTAVGLDLHALLSSTAQITRRQPADAARLRAKAIFELPPDLDPPGYAAVTHHAEGEEKGVTVFELRSGRGRQDVLPPSIHPTGAKLEWRGYDDPGVTVAPQALLDLFERVKDAARLLGDGWKGAKAGERVRPLAHADEPYEDGPLDKLVRERFGDVHTILERSGLYERVGDRWRHVGSTHAHGASILPDGRYWSHHVSDPAYRGLGQTPLSIGELYARLFHWSVDAKPRDWLQQATWSLSREPQPEAAEPAPGGVGVETINELEVDADGFVAVEDELPLDHPLRIATLRRGAFDNPWDWRETLDTLRRGKQDLVIPTERNARIILTHHPRLAGVFRYDRFTDCVYVVNAPFDRRPRVRPFGRTDSRALLAWLQDSPEFKEFKGKEVIEDAIYHAAAEGYSVDALEQSVRGLPSHDGRPRIATWLTDYAGADDTPLTRAIGRRFLIGLVARAVAPGCKLDEMLILEGEQGTGKSTLAQVLAGRLDLGESAVFSLASSKHLDLTREDESASESLRRVWLLELAELSTFRKAEIELLKNFLSRTSDHYRTKFDREATTKLRRNAWFGSTNDDTYLDDPTGARRFWPIHIERVDLDAFARDRDALLAEALVAYEDGERWWFELRHDTELMAALELEQTMRRVDSRFDDLVRALRPTIESQLQSPEKLPEAQPEGNVPPPTRAVILVSELLRIGQLDNSKATATALGHFMKRELRWHRVRAKMPGVRTWPRAWSPSRAWLDANGLMPTKKGKRT